MVLGVLDGPNIGLLGCYVVFMGDEALKESSSGILRHCPPKNAFVERFEAPDNAFLRYEVALPQLR